MLMLTHDDDDEDDDIDSCVCIVDFTVVPITKVLRIFFTQLILVLYISYENRWNKNQKNVSVLSFPVMVLKQLV